MMPSARRSNVAQHARNGIVVKSVTATVVLSLLLVAPAHGFCLMEDRASCFRISARGQASTTTMSLLSSTSTSTHHLQNTRRLIQHRSRLNSFRFDPESIADEDSYLEDDDDDDDDDEDWNQQQFARNDNFDNGFNNNNNNNNNFNGGNAGYDFTEEDMVKRKEASKAKQAIAKDFTTALCIIPPNSKWDTLQRARHTAGDPSYHEWPPAIRLFHPFNGSPFDVAEIIEALDLETFEITLDKWTIVPHLEAIEAQWQASMSDDSAMMTGSEFEAVADAEQEEIFELIAREERIGREKRLLRLRKEALRNQMREAGAEAKVAEADDSGQENEQVNDEGHVERPKQTLENLNNKKPKARKDASSASAKAKNKSPRAVLKSQREQYEEFNGPCLICLEPDHDSLMILQEVREALQECMDHDPYFSVASLYSWNTTDSNPSKAASASNLFGMNTFDRESGGTRASGESFRPIMPIGSFNSVSAAMDIAKKMKEDWEPLTFSIRDLHIISCRDEAGMDEIDADQAVAEAAASSASYSSNVEATMSLTNLDSKPWGCNAKIFLMGEEVQQDEDFNQKMVDKLVDEGISGGCDYTNDYIVLEDEEEVDTSELEAYLNTDEDWDDGMSFVLGRIHFYTGDKRSYIGMPASSTVDSKDRMAGDKGGPISGAARRRSTLHRDGSRWKDGEFGRKTGDFSPWSRRKENQVKKKASKRLNDG